MTVLFWILAAALIAAGVGFLAWPLVRGAPPERLDRRAATLAAHRARLAEIEADDREPWRGPGGGHLEEAQADVARSLLRDLGGDDSRGQRIGRSGPAGRPATPPARGHRPRDRASTPCGRDLRPARGAARARPARRARGRSDRPGGRTAPRRSRGDRPGEPQPPRRRARPADRARPRPRPGPPQGALVRGHRRPPRGAPQGRAGAPRPPPGSRPPGGRGGAAVRSAHERGVRPPPRPLSGGVMVRRRGSSPAGTPARARRDGTAPPGTPGARDSGSARSACARGG